MNKKQRTTIIIGLVLFLLMGFFHPSVYKIRVLKGKMDGYEGSMWTNKYTHSYSCILSGKGIDGERLILQWTLVIVATGVIVYLQKDKESDREK
ncbi:MAG: hypothetical protein HQ568_04480 [Calditrichaeota bacterium]|nr:hypothetical protein [Calditrichota bacterium]